MFALVPAADLPGWINVGAGSGGGLVALAKPHSAGKSPLFNNFQF